MDSRRMMYDVNGEELCRVLFAAECEEKWVRLQLKLVKLKD